MKDLLNLYNERKEAIRSRLYDFERVSWSSRERMFQELAFCICVPQSKAKICWNVIENLDNDLLFVNKRELVKRINGVRFHNNKSKYIIEARKKFFSGKFEFEREWLVKNIKGVGYKEASHFLRNLGHKNLAILDRHILKNLYYYGAIKEIPKTLTPKKYLEIEKLMKRFSDKVRIPLDELDLLFWSKETGEIFK
jgi:N-glycosylase/DNA lyase